MPFSNLGRKTKSDHLLIKMIHDLILYHTVYLSLDKKQLVICSSFKPCSGESMCLSCSAFLHLQLILKS